MIPNLLSFVNNNEMICEHIWLLERRCFLKIWFWKGKLKKPNGNKRTFPNRRPFKIFFLLIYFLFLKFSTMIQYFVLLFFNCIFLLFFTLFVLIHSTSVWKHFMLFVLPSTSVGLNSSPWSTVHLILDKWHPYIIVAIIKGCEWFSKWHLFFLPDTINFWAGICFCHLLLTSWGLFNIRN